MSLNWTVEKCANPNFLMSRDAEGNDLEDNTEWIKTECLIFFTMNAGLRSDVTAESAADFYARIHFWEMLNGAFCFSFDEKGDRVPDYFTPADVEARIGLHTNGWFDKKETFGAFVKRVTQWKESEAKTAYRDAMAKGEVA